MDQQRIQILVTKFTESTASAQEEAELMDWYRAANEQDIEWLSENLQEAELTRLEMLAVINKETGYPSSHKIKRLWPRIAAAASVLIALSVCSYFALHKKPVQQVAQNQPINIKPGSKKAILKLSNGKEISLTDAQAGTIAKQGNAIVTKTKDGQIVYQKDQVPAPAEVVYNTITTPRAGYYPLKMADGTIAILDAQSSIKYPVTFTGIDRVVEITGQVYFEVKHDAAHPFKVIVRGQTIEDIGTAFNINAYEDEPVIRTTLVEGSIKVNKTGNSAIVKPGQQAITLTANNSITLKDADIAAVISWKNGITSFKDRNIQEIMRQVSRWYDVDVQYEGPASKRTFVGDISRNVNLSDLLKILEFNNIHFRMEGKKLIVQP